MDKKRLMPGGRYLIIEQRGSGGSGKVYKARDIYTNEIYALKKYKYQDYQNLNAGIDKLEREIEILKKSSHKALPKVYDVVVCNDEYYIVMEFIEGKNLKEIISLNGCFSWYQTVKIMLDVTSCLFFLHSSKPPVVYRDLKPSNVMIDSKGQVKIVDFGSSKKYSSDGFLPEKAYGTKRFSAPEQYGSINGMELYNTDIRSDIYAVGTTMYYMLTGKCINAYSVEYPFIKGMMIPKRLKKIISKCVKRNPDERYDDDIQLISEMYQLIKKADRRK